jgi:starch-binding outer membrane protein, SusD/RagB family
MTIQMRRLAATGAALLVASVSSSCVDSQILEVVDPDVLNVQDYTTAAGAGPLRQGVVQDFAVSFSASTNVDSYIVVSGNLADEIRSTDTFDDRLFVNRRVDLESNPSMLTFYRNLHRARAGASRAINILQTTAPTPRFNIGELYALRGYAEMFFAELYCSGVPFSVEDGVTTQYGDPLTTTQILTRAVASFDSALALADTSTRVRFTAAVGKGRALLNLGRFADAAAAVTAVPTAFRNQTQHSQASARQENSVWNALSPNASRYTVVTREGTNGLNYLQTPADPRVPWATSTRSGFNSAHLNLPVQNKYTRTGPVTLADGIEARLIELEARLQGGTQADRDAVFAGLNNLRTTGTPTVPVIAGTAPTTQPAAVDLLFQERAFWMWLTGHRLGDMRRLVRQYGRGAETVYPTGDQAAPLIGPYGTATTLIIPFEERNNPKYNGCLDSRP